MKKIFRNNQVIITSLAIMIAIAGYLNFTNENVETVGVTSEYFQAETDFVGENKKQENVKKDDNKIVENEKQEDLNNHEDLNNKEKDEEEIVISEGNVEGSSEVVESSTNEEGTSIGEAVMVNSNASINYFYNVRMCIL